MHKSKPKSQKKWKSFYTHLCKVIKSRYKKVIGSDGKADFNPDDVHKREKEFKFGGTGGETNNETQIIITNYGNKKKLLCNGI